MTARATFGRSPVAATVGAPRPPSGRGDDGDLPEDALVLHPLPAYAADRGPLDKWPEIEAVCARGRRGADLELEPGDLIRPDIGRGLDRDPVVARPRGAR